jgi:Fe2+ or Zn2+ uptake regulation protein
LSWALRETRENETAQRSRKRHDAQQAVQPFTGRAPAQNRRYHFICTACGHVVELESPEIEALQVEAIRDHGFSVEGLELELQGKCYSCLGDAAGARE